MAHQGQPTLTDSFLDRPHLHRPAVPAPVLRTAFDLEAPTDKRATCKLRVALDQSFILVYPGYVWFVVLDGSGVYSGWS